MRTRLLLIFWAFAVLGFPTRAATEDQRREHLNWMLKNLPDAPTWEWQQKTGALPPDYDALPSANFLPDPFKSHDGRTVNMPADWAARREEIKQLYQKHILGSLPPKPNLDRIVPVSETESNGYVTRVVRLEYGNKITTQVTLTLPEGGGPFPVLIGGGNWSASLIRRGYAACEYPTSVDQPTNLPELYPGYDFATMGQRAWTAQLVVDYLLTLPQIDPNRIAMTGYSRGGKMATIAAAFDERIAAVIAGSTGVGGVLPWRLSGERGMGEGVESTTRSFPLWFAPQLRFFSGREDRLPVDANLLVALVAPRACLMTYGLNDEVWQKRPAPRLVLPTRAAQRGPGRKIHPLPRDPTPGRATPFAITFDLPATAPRGKATLRVAICGGGAREIDVAVNGQAVGKIDRLLVDGAITRHSIRGLWYEREVAFAAALLKPGENVLILTIPAGPVNNGVIYDCLRLELDESLPE